jgi:2-dehydro-3-deoxyphosphogluconate aldolase / (4S)-4-hydroxy-2-oxoglutarate aldolase
VNREQVRARIEEIAIIPAVRVRSKEEALFAASTVNHAGIPIAEITTTFPGALDAIADVIHHNPGMIVGAGTVLDKEVAKRCVQAGAQFLTSPGLVMEVVDFAKAQGVVVFPGALTPTEIIAAWKAGSDFVKIFPCSALGGEHYVQSLKRPFAQVPLIASGGVNQQTARAFLLAGATALGVGSELIPTESVVCRKEDRIRELARRFRKVVAEVHKHKIA